MKITEKQEIKYENNLDFIRFEQTDIHGISRSKIVPVRNFEVFCEKGLNFFLGHLALDAQGLVVPGTNYLEKYGYPDSLIKPDLKTFQILPWADKTARVLCEPYFLDDRPVPAAPRLIARKLLSGLDAMGYRLLSGFEYEFILVDASTRQPVFAGIQIFATLRNNFNPALLSRILRDMSDVGIDIITANVEYAPGQLEINYAPAWGVSAADQAFTFKNGIKEIAQQHGLIASFMTKPYTDQSANCCHYHQSLWKEDKNLFIDTSNENGISDICRHFLAGQLIHAPAISALAAPTVNCAKRYRLNSFAPTNASWGFENRTCAIRVKATGDERTRIENRCGGGASNPYLLMEACLAAGLDGLKNKIEPPSSVPGVAYHINDVIILPTRLEQALDALEKDAVLIEALGSEFCELFIAVKRHEISKAKAAIADYDSPEFNNRVDPWEIEQYFEFF